jgi:RNA polymerase sigma factor (sigma-70 family)
MTVTLLTHAARTDPRADAELVSRFVSAHDSQAFAAVVHRHGPLVYGVCRRTLGDSPDADDAFQATFLVLVTKAGTLKKSDALGPWLFGVAHRIARKARWKRGRRQSTEQQVHAMPHRELMTPDRLESDELSRAFDEELAKLPDDMRRAVVLCELQGVGRADAARQLRISEGTLSSRLGRARKKLAEALTKRGLGLAIPTAVAVGSKLAANTAELATGAAVAPPAVVTLVQEALKTMAISKLKFGAVVLAAAACCTLLAFAADKPTANAEPVKTEAKTALKVGREEVSEQELAAFALRRGFDTETYLTHKLVRAEADRRGVTVTPEEVKAALARLEKQHPGGAKGFEEERRKENSYAPRGYWVEYQFTPDLLLEKMVGVKAEPTADEVRVRYENETGERRSYQMWVQFDDAKKLDALVIELNAGRVKFGESSDPPGLKELGGEKFTHSRTGTMGPKAEFDWPEAQPLLDTLFRMKKVGEFARTTFPGGGGHRLVVLTGVIPAKSGVTFESQKPVVTAAVRRHKMELLKADLRRSLVDPVKEQFLLDVLKKYFPEEYADYQKRVEEQSK